jgi:hypothetical protein
MPEDKPRPVIAPPDMHPLVDKVTEKMTKLFDSMNMDIGTGRRTMAGTQYMLIGLEALGVYLKKALDEILDPNGRNIIMYKLGFAIGNAEAMRLKELLDLEPGPEHLIAGPIFAAHAGFVFVKFLPGSNPVPNEEYVLHYDHPGSFEAVYWKEKVGKTEEPVCHFGCGYAAGWCSAAMGIELTAIETLCEAKGDHTCRYVMVPDSRVLEYQERLDEFR